MDIRVYRARFGRVWSGAVGFSIAWSGAVRCGTVWFGTTTILQHKKGMKKMTSETITVDQKISILENAKELLLDANNWCKGYYARNSKNEDVFATDNDACKWCPVGAILKVAADIIGLAKEAKEIERFAVCELFHVDSLIEFREYHDRPDVSHNDIIAEFDGWINTVSGWKQTQGAV